MRSRRFMAIAIALSLILSFQIQEAMAALSANQQNNKNLATGIWRTQLATATAGATTGPYQITWTGGANKQYELISIINTGNFD